jgi:hypothetical protein
MLVYHIDDGSDRPTVHGVQRRGDVAARCEAHSRLPQTAPRPSQLVFRSVRPITLFRPGWPAPGISQHRRAMQPLRHVRGWRTPREVTRFVEPARARRFSELRRLSATSRWQRPEIPRPVSTPQPNDPRTQEGTAPPRVPHTNSDSCSEPWRSHRVRCGKHPPEYASRRTAASEGPTRGWLPAGESATRTRCPLRSRRSPPLEHPMDLRPAPARRRARPSGRAASGARLGRRLPPICS